MPSDAIAVEPRRSFVSRVWHGVLLGFLIGAANLVFVSPSFKGNIAEFEFALGYIAYTTVYWLLGGVIDFVRTRYPKPKVLSGTIFYWILVCVLAGAIVARMLFLFPAAVGLFHPTHSTNLAEGVGACMGRLASDKADSEELKMHYCECWAEVVMTSYEHGDPRPPLEISKAADAICRGK
jgi:hypothetical protein